MSYFKPGQMDLTERLAIETGLCRGESFKKIANKLNRHPSTISHEVLTNRTRIKATYHAGKDCTRARQCTRTGLCGASHSACHHKCKFCRGFDCRTVCEGYRSMACHKPDRPPYVCNSCREHKLCVKGKYICRSPHYSSTSKNCSIYSLSASSQT